MNSTGFWQQHFWVHFGFSGLDQEEYTRRTTAVQLGVFTAVSGTVFCLIYVWLGFPEMIISSASYILLFCFALLYLAISKNFSVYRYVQLGLILLFPLFNHLLVGGFVESSAVILASFITPVIALTFVSRQTARVFFYLYVVVILVGGGWELMSATRPNRMPDFVITLFFIIDLLSITGIIYLLIEGFLNKQDQLRAELRQSLETLRTTQNQLIQSEKMASLGELTAGIAHEIQNPLNFVNNFAEVSAELVEEIQQERQKTLAERDQSLEADLLTDLQQNLQKISHHGGRAASIVRGMLQHSRAAGGQREPTDLNALADEYLRLAYHGLRAKDKTFNAEMQVDFDATLPLVSVLPQDLGRVLLNLFTNAFYAVNKKAKSVGADATYRPTVSVRSRLASGAVKIIVSDNGTGIPAEVIDKIFQPFFTTKPTGEGTGLGLSLAYDIITKSHSGTLTVESQPGQGATFTVSLPV